MHCCVPFCSNSPENVAESERITFHKLPNELHLRVPWLRVLNKHYSHLPNSAVVCSQHFLNEDMYETESGLREIRVGAIPSTVHVCLICLDLDSKLFSMGKHNLDEAYEKLTGHSLCDMGNFQHALCVECTQRLINFNKFRDKSLRAYTLMMDLVNKHESVTKQHIKSIDRVKNQLVSNITKISLGPDRYNSYGLEHIDECKKEIEVDSLVHDNNGTVSVKIEEDDEIVMVIEDDDEIKVEVKNEDGEYSGDDFTLSYDDNDNYASEETIMQDTKLLNNDLCKVVLRNMSSFDVEQIQKQLKQGRERFSFEDTNIYSFKSARSSAPSTSRRAQFRLSSADCESALATTRLPTNTEAEIDDNDQLDNNSPIADETFVYHLKPQTGRERFEYNKSTNTSNLNKLHTGKKPLACKLCEYKTNQNSHLKTHMYRHTGEKPFACELCEYKCTHKSRLKTHMNIHTGEKPFECKFCEYKTNHNSLLKTHMYRHTGEKPFACELCEFKCIQKTYLKTHMYRHTGEKPFACKLCEYKCVRKNHLKTHMIRHTGEKPFTCDICECKFSNKFTLVRHMKSHTGEQSFESNLCEYNQNSHLKTHMIRLTGEQSFTCDICECKFSRKFTLVRHMKSHTGEKPFTCDICECKYSRKLTLVRHMKRHTGEKPFA